MKLPILLLALNSFAAATPAAIRSQQIPDDLHSSDWQNIPTAHEAWKHRFNIHSVGSVAAHHPPIGWRMDFDETGFTLQLNDDSSQWGLELVLSPSLRVQEFAKPIITREHPGGNSTRRSDEPQLLLCYRRTAEITKWFINDSRSLEQGWTLSAPAEIRLHACDGFPGQVSPRMHS
jgi:hypothetical protein